MIKNNSYLLKTTLIIPITICIGFLVSYPADAQEEKTPGCSDIWGYEAEDSTTLEAGNKCRYHYNSCLAFPWVYEDGYSTCAGSDGGCWDIHRWAYTDENNCPIRDDFSIDYEGYSLTEGFTFREGNIAYCECLADCRKQFWKDRPCKENYESCCASIAMPEQGTLSDDSEPLIRKPDDIAADLADKCQDQDKNWDQIEGGTRELLQSVGNQIMSRTNTRTDLDASQKERLSTLVQELIDKAEVLECKKGSYVKTCQWIKLNFGSCLYIDPMSSPDIVRHEMGHIIAETFMNEYQYPSGKSSHAMLGFSSDKHRAFDEALANLISIDLVGGTRYVTFSQTSSSDPLSFTKDTGQDINFATKTIKEYRATRDTNTTFDPNNKTKSELEWYGIPDNKDNMRELARKRMDAKLAELKELSKKDSFWRAITGTQTAETKAKLEKVQFYSKMLYPPAYSSRNELAVAFLMYDLLGDSPTSYRLGGIINSSNAFSAANGRGPKSELEFLQGYILWQTSQGGEKSSLVEKVLNLATNDTHRRLYFEDEL